MIVYNKLFYMLIDRGMKKGELARIANLPPNTMQRLAKNKIVNTDTLNRICAALKCKPGDIMDYIEDETDKTLSQLMEEQQKNIREAETASKAVKAALDPIKTVVKAHSMKN